MVAQPGSAASGSAPAEKTLIPGVRPSPLDGRLTTSTGTRSLDSLLVGHAGLAMGCSLLVEESGTTDFGGSLLRYFAAEGVLQGHIIHVLGVGDAWGRELPGVSIERGSAKIERQGLPEEKMKIAWRYERLGEFKAGPRGGHTPSVHTCGDALLGSSKSIILISYRQKLATICRRSLCSAEPDTDFLS